MADDRRAKVPTNVSLKLRSRQQVARQLGELLAADDPRVVEVCHRALLAAGPDLLAMFGRSLDTADPRAVRRLGTLAAAYPDRAAVVGGLRTVARDPQNTDLKRMAAMVILEQFLDEELEPHFFSTLRDPAQVAMNSLVRVLEGAHRDRNLLLAYLSALEEQHPDALATVLDSLSRLPGDQSVEILKLLAQHQDADLAEQAQQLLVQQRTPEALFALRMLDLVMPPARREGLQRAMRKLRMTGAAFPPWAVPPPGTRALLTGIDGRGAAAVWFVVPRPAGPVQLLSLVLSDSAGVADAFGGDDFSPESFPAPAPVGTLHRGLESRTAPGDARPGRRPAGGPAPGSYPSLDAGGARALSEEVDDLLPYLTVDEAEFGLSGG